MLEFPTSADWNTTANAIASVSAAGGGTLFVPGGVTITPIAGQNNVALDFLGPNIVYQTNTDPFPGGTSNSASRLIYSQHPGGHPSQANDTLAILSRPVGSGANGPNAMDIGLSISSIKQNYQSASAAQGQVDGISIYVRNGGNDGVESDAIALEANISNFGATGTVFGLEMLSTNYNRSSVLQWSVDVQAAVIDTLNSHAWGYVAIIAAGAGSAAFLAEETSPGLWSNSFQHIDNTGATKFVVDHAGNTSGTSFKAAAPITSAWGFDASAAATAAIPNGGNAILAAGRGFIYIEEGSSHNAAMYIMGAGAASLVAGIGAIFVAPTTAPAAGKASIAFDGSSAYRIYNNIGASVAFTVAGIRIGTSA
jgi:hypothetical protein